ncbi:flagellin [Geomicrobium sp. JSM 1781026]|uniref:flagellin N-terminal helical domain-containing protein n=1 Tax=Geomicrobium sp. JSM 1781026 TaxID=3344580 RepID=UPI0035C239DB
MIINNNMSAMNAHRQLGVNQNQMQSSMEKLSSGLRINRAGDDAAGLAISEKMRAQISGLDQASRNAQDGISLIQTAEGALDESHSILQRMRELAVQASNDTNQDQVDREAIQEEMNALAEELDRIAGNTEFNNKNLLDGTFEGKFHIGANSGQSIDVAIGNLNAYTLNVAGTGEFDTASTETASVKGIDGQTVLQDERGNNVAVSIQDDDGNAQWYNLSDVSVNENGDGLVVNSGAEALEIRESTTYTQDGETLTRESHSEILEHATGDDVTFSGDVLRNEAGDIVAYWNDSDDQWAASITNDGTDGITFGTEVGDIDESTLNVVDATYGGISVSSQEDADSAINDINNAINQVSEQRSYLGAIQNRLEHTINNLDNASENLQAAESRIRDVDMASEMMEFTKNNILSQASQSMLAQANQLPQSVLQLLQ